MIALWWRNWLIPLCWWLWSAHTHKPLLASTLRSFLLNRFLPLEDLLDCHLNFHWQALFPLWEHLSGCISWYLAIAMQLYRNHINVQVSSCVFWRKKLYSNKTGEAPQPQLGRPIYLKFMMCHHMRMRSCTKCYNQGDMIYQPQGRNVMPMVSSCYPTYPLWREKSQNV